MSSFLEMGDFIDEFFLEKIHRSHFLQEYGKTANPPAPKFCYLYTGMANQAIDLLRKNARSVKIVTLGGGDDGDMSIYDVFPDPYNVNVLGELIMQEALEVLSKKRITNSRTLRTHEGLDKDKPLFDVYRYKKWGMVDGQVVSDWVEQRKPIFTVWFCHYWVYFLYLQDWTPLAIADFFKVTANRICQIISECRKKLTNLYEEDNLHKVEVVPSHKRIDDIDEYFDGWVNVPKEKEVAILKGGLRVSLDRVRDTDKIDKIVKVKLSEDERYSIGIDMIKNLPQGVTYDWESDCAWPWGM
jgi:DNA-directed RNA polymerase specialized sigma24 family protein